jgi:hypothetical protein
MSLKLCIQPVESGFLHWGLPRSRILPIKIKPRTGGSNLTYMGDRATPTVTSEIVSWRKGGLLLDLQIHIQARAPVLTAADIKEALWSS